MVNRFPYCFGMDYKYLENIDYKIEEFSILGELGSQGTTVVKYKKIVSELVRHKLAIQYILLGID